MSKRTMPNGYQEIAASATPQPLVGTAIGAAVAPSNTPVKVLVASSGVFQVKDWVQLVDPSTSPVTVEKVMVLAIPDGTHLLVGKPNAYGGTSQGGVTNAYTTNAFVVLAALVNNVMGVCKIGNAATIMLGSSCKMNSTTGAYCIMPLTSVLAGQPIFFSGYELTGANPETVADYWVEGTEGDEYLVTLGAV